MCVTSSGVVLQAGCAAVAIILHYFFLTAFMWMLMKGIVLYVLLVKVFAQIDWKYYTAFTLLSYGEASHIGVKLFDILLSLTHRWPIVIHDIVHSTGPSKNR